MQENCLKGAFLMVTFKCIMLYRDSVHVDRIG